jgi:thioredoxin reductase
MSPDVLIAGGGPAGLTAALVLARAGRDVLVVDTGEGRNVPADHSYNVFTRDGAPPAELRRLGRTQAEDYGARFLEDEAVHAEADEDGVRVRLADGREIAARRLLLATGVVDDLPDLPGLRAAWGHTVVHCPYCHGYELKGRPTAVLGSGEVGFEQARLVMGWTDQVTLLTGGPAKLTGDQQEALAGRGITIREELVESVEVEGRDVRAVVFASGEHLACGALYLRPDQHLRGPLPDALDLERTEAGHIATDEWSQTSAPNVFAAGDAVTPMQLVQAAAASGASAAAFLNHDLVAQGLTYTG